METIFSNNAQMSNENMANATAANTNSVNGVNNQTADQKKKKRTYKPQPVYRVLKKAHSLFEKQIDKDTEMKKKCIEYVVNSSTDIYPDRLRFELDFRKERDRLTDSIRFNKACGSLNLIPANVADHVVFEGKTTMEKVLKDGLHVLGENVHMFNAPIWEDTESLYVTEKKEGADE